MPDQKLSLAMREALKWFRDHGGDGCFPEVNRQVLLAQGERAPVTKSTWHKLAAAGRVEFYGHHRIRIIGGAA